MNEDSWNARYDLNLEMYLEQVASANMRVFMGMPTQKDLINCTKAKEKQEKIRQLNLKVQPEESVNCPIIDDTQL